MPYTIFFFELLVLVGRNECGPCSQNEILVPFRGISKFSEKHPSLFVWCGQDLLHAIEMRTGSW